LAANPVYDSDGEIPETPRGLGFETVDGFRDRTPWTHSLDLHLDSRGLVRGRSLQYACGDERTDLNRA
jgi:hypothetical protein